MVSTETSFEGLTRVSKDLSSIVPRISCYVCEKHESRRCFENERLFPEETNMFLWSACRVFRMLPIDTSFEGITRDFKEVSSIVPKYRVPLRRARKSTFHLE